MSTFIWKEGEFKQVATLPLTDEQQIAILEKSLHVEKPYGSRKQQDTLSWLYDEDGNVIGHKLTKTI